MEHFVVSARKYRPQNFEDVVGQKAISNTLLNAIKNDHLAQALLFTGPRGVGKTSCARILAKTINQAEADTPQEDSDFSFNIFELDAASNNSVDDIRNLTDQVRIPPQTGKYKVYIIDEVHMLSQSAFNAFLKTLEEPPKHAIFILATTEKHKIIPTILSRCQIFDFKRITVTDIKEHLKIIAQKEGVEAEDDALHIIAQKADGAMRDALSTYDRVVSYCGNKLTRQAVTENLNVLDYESFFKVTDLLLDNQIAEALVFFNSILGKGFDGQHFISGLATHFRDLMVCQNQKTISLLEVGEQVKTTYFEQSQKADMPFLIQALELANACDFDYKLSRNQRLHVEICLMQLASLNTTENTQLKKKANPKILSPQESQTYQHKTSNGSQNSASAEINTANSTVNKQHETDKERLKTSELNTAPTEFTQTPQKSNSVEATQDQAHSEHTADADLQLSQNEPTEQTNHQENSVKEAVTTPGDKNKSSETSLSDTSTETDENKLPKDNSTETEPPANTNKTQENYARPTAEKLNSARLNSEDKTSEAPKPSGLSLKAIKHKKALKAEKERLKSTKEQRTSLVSQEDLEKHWKAFTKSMKSEGQKILASTIGMCKPVLKAHLVCIEVPNETMKAEILLQQGDLMGYLRDKLDNTEIELDISVVHQTEEEHKKFLYTDRDKYDQLLKTNPKLDKLRQIFDLDLR